MSALMRSNLRSSSRQFASSTARAGLTATRHVSKKAAAYNAQAAYDAQSERLVLIVGSRPVRLSEQPSVYHIGSGTASARADMDALAELRNGLLMTFGKQVCANRPSLYQSTRILTRLDDRGQTSVEW